MKYPIGIQSFDQIINEGFVYIDKTDMIYSLANEGKIYFLSRPRRFGKSLLVSTLKNYFLGRKELFSGLKIDSLEKEWNVHPVFHIDFNGSDFTHQTRYPGKPYKQLLIRLGKTILIKFKRNRERPWKPLHKNTRSRIHTDRTKSRGTY